MKGLMLSAVFINCYRCHRKLTVSELLAAHTILKDHYGRRPHVLSNMLRRYWKFGLLYRNEDVVRGHPYRYNLTEKGFKRLCWMCNNRERYLYSGTDLLEPLLSDIIHMLEEKKMDDIDRRINSLREQIGSSQTRSLSI